MLAKLRDTGDWLLRLLFFAIAPSMLVRLALLFPVSGAVLQIALALLVFLAGSAARRYALRSPLFNALLSSQLEFEAYYRERPPRPFLYYVLYPLLFPYWLAVSDARREFLLYKGYTLISFGLLLVSLVWQYARAFPPELGLAEFAPLAVGTLVAEAVAVLTFSMPFVTSVVHFHRRRAPWRLGSLLLAAGISLALVGVRLERRRDPIVSYATRVRVRLRSEAAPAAAVEAQRAALNAAWPLVVHGAEDIDRDGKVMGEPLSAAHEALDRFYKFDEAAAFDLWYSNKLLVVYFESHRGHAPIWLARDDSGAITADEKRLPPDAFRAMRHASR
ncbi:MAG TPA: hypothetical protein VJV78_48040 [Polyangiales bacterium]|nr:hypothetical protein [Polyangiales bacterium]